MDSPWLILILFNWDLKFIFLLMFLPSYISFGVSLDETWGIKWSLICSTMILISLIRSFLCFSLDSSSSDPANYPLMYLSRSFSLRMIPIPYLHARNFSIPSSLSWSLVLGTILSRRSLKKYIYKNEKITLPGDEIDWGELIGTLGFYRFHFFTSQNSNL